MAPFDWNGNGRKDMGDYYIDYEIYNDIYNNAENDNYAGGTRPYKKKKKYTDEELDANWVLIRTVWIICGLVVGILGLVVNILSLFGGYVSWLGLIGCPIILVIIFRYLKKNGWPKK